MIKMGKISRSVMTYLLLILVICQSAQVSAKMTDGRIGAGADAQWSIGSKKGLTFIVDGDFLKLTGVMVSGRFLNNADFTARPGCTIITLKPEYLASLKAGTYSMVINYVDKEIRTSFTIKNKQKSIFFFWIISKAALFIIFCALIIYQLRHIYK